MDTKEKEHKCERRALEWEEEPLFTGETISYKGRCPVCGRVYEEVFTAVDGLWDVEKEEYVYI